MPRGDAARHGTVCCFMESTGTLTSNSKAGTPLSAWALQPSYPVQHPEPSSLSSESCNAGRENSATRGETYSWIPVPAQHPLHSSEPQDAYILGPSPAFGVVSRAGPEGTPTATQALISRQGRSKGPSWLPRVLCQPAGELLTQGFQTGLLAIIDCLRLCRKHCLLFRF